MTVIFYFKVPAHQSSWLSAQGSKHFAHLYGDIHSIPGRARNGHSETTSKTPLSSRLPLQLNKSGLGKHHVSRVTWWVWVWDESSAEVTRLAAGQRTRHHLLSAVWLATGWVPWFLPADTLLPGEDTSSPTYTTLSPSHFLRSYHHLTFYVYLHIYYCLLLSTRTQTPCQQDLGNAHRCTSMVCISTWPMTVTRMNKWIQRTKFPKVYVKILPSC